MAAVIAEALESIPLATTNVDMTFHNGRDETHVVGAEVVDFESTLATARVKMFPINEYGNPDPTLIASGDTTARPFDS